MYQTLHSAGTVFTFYPGMQSKIPKLLSKTLQELSLCAKAVEKEQVQNKPGTASALKSSLGAAQSKASDL